MFFRFRMALQRFMYGRYGMDGLNRFLFIVYFILSIAGFILRRIPRCFTAYMILYFITLGVMFWFFFRVFSRNIEKRRMENTKFLGIKHRFINARNLQKDKRRNRKTHVYRKCPNCRANIKLPRKKGKHTCTCPRCRVDFKVKVR